MQSVKPLPIGCGPGSRNHPVNHRQPQQEDDLRREVLPLLEDLADPLTAIACYVDAAVDLQQSGAYLTREELAEILGKIRSQIVRAAEIRRGLLKLAAGEEGSSDCDLKWPPPLVMDWSLSFVRTLEKTRQLVLQVTLCHFCSFLGLSFCHSGRCSGRVTWK